MLAHCQADGGEAPVRQGPRSLRDLLARETVLAPGVYDALTARLAEIAGFEVVYLTGAGVSYTQLGKPDLGLVSFTEMLERLGAIASATRAAVIADGDTGYGGVLNVHRTVQAYEAAGAAAIQLEDQVFPKRCGHLSGKEILPLEEAVAKVRAAVATRREMLVIARTDALTVCGIEEAVRRARAYRQVGADLIFVESPRTVDDLRYIRSHVEGPLVANLVEGGRTPLLSVQELAQLGYQLVIFPNTVTRVVARTALEVYKELKATGSSARLLGRMLTFRELNDMLGLSQLEALEARFLGGVLSEIP